MSLFTSAALCVLTVMPGVAPQQKAAQSPPQARASIWSVKPDPRYMQHAQYVLPVPDENPRIVYGSAPASPTVNVQAELKFVGKELRLRVLNREANPEFLMVADYNLLGYLEARDAGGTWQPIEYHPWCKCGNSYFTIALAAGAEWNFRLKPLPKGRVTQIRWHYGSSTSPLLSNVIEAPLAKTRFALQPELAQIAHIDMRPTWPMLAYR